MKKTINGKEFVVVTKTPKRFHRIPRLDAKAQLQERQREVATKSFGPGDRAAQRRSAGGG